MDRQFPAHLEPNMSRVTTDGSSSRIPEISSEGKILDVTAKRKGVQDETEESEAPGKRKRVKGPQGNAEDHNNSGGLEPTEPLQTSVPSPPETGKTMPLSSAISSARAAQYPADPQCPPLRKGSSLAIYDTSRPQHLPNTFPALLTDSHLSKGVANSAALDATTAAITRAGSSLDVGDTSLLNDLCEKLSSRDLYTHPITRQRIIELLEIAGGEIAKTRAAGLWEITARVAQERHFVCPPQMEGTVKSYIKMVDTVNENSGSFDEDDLIAQLVKINISKPFQKNIPANTACLFCRRRKIKCDGVLPRCDMCTKHRQAKCEYPQKSYYGGFSSGGGLHYVVPMGPDIIAAAAALAVPGGSLPVHLDSGSPTFEKRPGISREMPLSSVLAILVEHKCQDITKDLDLPACSEYPKFSGGFGEIYQGQLKDGTLVAIKCMRITVDPHSSQQQKHFNDAAREIHTWSKLNHRYVSRFLGLAEFRGQIAMVSPWAQHGSLPAFLAKRPYLNRPRLCMQIAEGLAFLHQCNVVHGDLKGANVLVSRAHEPLLADFGSATLQERTLQFTCTTAHNFSLRWAAPELLAGAPLSVAADVYALGMVSTHVVHTSPLFSWLIHRLFWKLSLAVCRMLNYGGTWLW
ncbi:hypothetical protein FS749_002649 [Ceratobasidium sp. UAMH 11750]|nr:hypothetical protein FS749_002649 [Ceratobasidium sp. UAMH 11750]